MIRAMEPRQRLEHEFVPQAVFGRPPAYFTSLGVGIQFREAVEYLNAYQVAELVVDDLPFALLHYAGTPDDETEVYLPGSIPLERIGEVIERIRSELDLPHAALKWQRHSAEAPF